MEIYNRVSREFYNDSMDIYQDIWQMKLDVRSVHNESNIPFPELREEGKYYRVSGYL